jgi:hypothetical protein
VIDSRPNADPNRPSGFGPSLGVVDDTCEAHFEVSLQRSAGGAPLLAKAVAFVGPPDFAPDRRPFLSLADELNDRTGDAAQRNAALSDAELDRWVEDLFERVYETVSLFNVDLYRNQRAAAVPPEKLRASDIDAGTRANPTRAMGGSDALRNGLYKLAAPTDVNPLPLSQHARMRHRAMSDLQNLIELVALDPDRIKNIVRPPFEVEAFEGGNASSMRMPPFMRQSNALPLTLAGWQYELLLRWVARTAARTSAAPLRTAARAGPPARRPMSRAAVERRAGVLARIDAAEGHQ